MRLKPKKNTNNEVVSKVTDTTPNLLKIWSNNNTLYFTKYLHAAP